VRRSDYFSSLLALDWRDSPVTCRSFWLGEPVGTIRYEDPDDRCAKEQLRRLKTSASALDDPRR
jgi:hypothetical protein